MIILKRLNKNINKFKNKKFQSIYPLKMILIKQIKQENYRITNQESKKLTEEKKFIQMNNKERQMIYNIKIKIMIQINYKY